MLMDATLRDFDSGAILEEWSITSDPSMPISDVARIGLLNRIREFETGESITITAVFTFEDHRTKAFPFMSAFTSLNARVSILTEFRELLNIFRDAIERQPRLVPRQVA